MKTFLCDNTMPEHLVDHDWCDEHDEPATPVVVTDCPNGGDCDDDLHHFGLGKHVDEDDE